MASSNDVDIPWFLSGAIYRWNAPRETDLAVSADGQPDQKNTSKRIVQPRKVTLPRRFDAHDPDEEPTRIGSARPACSITPGEGELPGESQVSCSHGGGEYGRPILDPL